MLNHETRNAILRLSSEGHSVRFIAKALGLGRESTKKVIEQNTAIVPEVVRAGRLDPFLNHIRELNTVCAGNLVRVQEELRARHGVDVPYSTLTRFCRDAEIGVVPKQAAGRYHFAPGKEMQHDTSPHDVKINGRITRLQCASLVMCFSRRRFMQCYPRWTRFHVKVFLTAALQFLGASAEQCMLDNSTVIMTGGTGPDAVAVPEMKAFADRFGFTFVSHHVGDANRSARVEGPFWHVENNFYPGRTFADLRDVNAQAITWCRDYNGKYHKKFDGIPDELGAIERPALRSLPPWIPEPTQVHPRKVDAEAYIVLHTNLYSVPESLIDHDVEVHETYERLRVFDGHKLLAEHDKHPDGARARVTVPEHRRARWRRSEPAPPSPQEATLRGALPSLGALCDILRKRRGGQALTAMRRLHRIWLDYPNDAVEAAVARAIAFDVLDLAQIERMILINIRGSYFNLPTDEEEPDGR